ncbi:hypothetical protein [Brachybacterium saurashtrense]|uniref:DUF429 domain-containing protein n=1 Tax=Brachybacterium saurashtrense TaxID=556288 RepID=A0A345YJT8_9MICO|nr:hypothetical protein [Brachybacterium saurashtrense]AXK44190.1 hypothetical protein DWV08_00150 [Brachybacterium saurashtrense]RRR21462.1 hypothetical protein DXU92_14050 [Brachybacterium saurashtrense]
MFILGIDIGSVRRPGGFAWADSSGTHSGTDDPSAPALLIERALAEGRQVAIAVECPLSVPVPATTGRGWEALGRARTGEGNRSWSAGAGSGSLATGLVQLTWLLHHLVEHSPVGLRVTTQVPLFASGHARVLLVEAMVTSSGKPVPVDGVGQDEADALAAARRLAEILGSLPEHPPSDVRCAPAGALNLAATAALHAGAEIDPAELRQDVVVARALPAQSG